jgi:hypothetical protein
MVAYHLLWNQILQSHTSPLARGGIIDTHMPCIRIQIAKNTSRFTPVSINVYAMLSNF